MQGDQNTHQQTTHVNGSWVGQKKGNEYWHGWIHGMGKLGASYFQWTWDMGNGLYACMGLWGFDQDMYVQVMLASIVLVSLRRGVWGGLSKERQFRGWGGEGTIGGGGGGGLHKRG